MTASAPRPTLTGIVRESGTCERCTREIGRVFQVEHPDGREAAYGRRCAAVVTGYKVTWIEREAAAALRHVELVRRREIVCAERPGLADRAPCVFGTASSEDCWWGGRGWAAYPTWQDYVDACSPA